MFDIEGGLDRPVPDPEKNSPQSLRNRLDNGTKLLPISQEGKIKGRERWGLVLPLAGILGIATALATDLVADYFSPLQSSDNSHRTSYSPPKRDLGIPAHIVDQVNKYLGIRTARGDSGIPSVYKIFGPAVYKRAPEPSVQLRDPEAITPEECPNFHVRSDMENSPNQVKNVVDIVITKDTTVRLVGRVLIFPDEEQALDTAYSSTFYQDGLRIRLEQATNFLNRFFPFKFEIEVVREPLMFPEPFSQASGNLSGLVARTRYRTERGDNMFLVDGFDEQQYSIAIFMITPNPDILFRNLRERSPSGGWVWRYPWASPPGRIAGFASFPWHVLDERNFIIDTVDMKGGYNGMWAPEHEITHAFGLPHNLTNRRSILYEGMIPNPDRAIIAKEDVQEKCFS